MIYDFLKNPKVNSKWKILGSSKPQDNKNFLVVGTRRPSKYGLRVIESVIPMLVKNGFTILSDFSPGCCLYSQKVALSCGGRVVGILGYGVNEVSKKTERRFFEKMATNDNSCIVMPFREDTVSSKATFSLRTKILSYFCQNLLVIEAKEDSKTFGLVQRVLELGKEVYAVPGSIFSKRSKGTNLMIYQGATPFINFSDFEIL